MAYTLADLLSEEELAKFLADKNMDYAGFMEPAGAVMPPAQDLQVQYNQPEVISNGVMQPTTSMPRNAKTVAYTDPAAFVNDAHQSQSMIIKRPAGQGEQTMEQYYGKEVADKYMAGLAKNSGQYFDSTGNLISPNADVGKAPPTMQGLMDDVMKLAKRMPIQEIMKTPQYQMLQAMSPMYKQQADIDAQKAQAESARAQAAKYMAEAKGGGIRAKAEPKIIESGGKQYSVDFSVPGGKVTPLMVDGTHLAGKESKEDKGLPSTALKMQQSEVDALNAASSISANTNALLNQLETGALNLSLLGNLTSEARQQLGISNQESRNYNSFRRTLEKLRNDSLRLNKGVQTEGDAQRAWNELMGSINDTESVKQRLQEIAALNEQAVDLRKYNIENIRSNFGVPPLDTTKAEVKVSPLQGGSQPKPQLGSAASQIPTGSGNLSPQQVQRLQELRAKYRTGG